MAARAHCKGDREIQNPLWATWRRVSWQLEKWSGWNKRTAKNRSTGGKVITKIAKVSDLLDHGHHENQK